MLPFLLPLLAGCYEGQKEQLAACENNAARAFSRPVPGEPFKSIQTCMDKTGYRFIGWEDGVVCDMASVIKGQPALAGGDVICFEPEKLGVALALSHRCAEKS